MDALKKISDEQDHKSLKDSFLQYKILKTEINKHIDDLRHICDEEYAEQHGLSNFNKYLKSRCQAKVNSYLTLSEPKRLFCNVYTPNCNPPAKATANAGHKHDSRNKELYCSQLCGDMCNTLQSVVKKLKAENITDYRITDLNDKFYGIKLFFGLFPEKFPEIADLKCFNYYGNTATPGWKLLPVEYLCIQFKFDRITNRLQLSSVFFGNADYDRVNHKPCLCSTCKGKSDVPHAYIDYFR